MKNIVYTLLLVSSIGIVAYLASVWFLGKFVDNPVVWAEGNYPLGKNHQYIIEPNNEVVSEDGSVLLEKDMFYTFRKASEQEQKPYLSGRYIGSTTIQLDEHLGKEVYIEGYFSMGTPIILKENNIPDFLLLEEKVVLNITSLQEVE